MRRGNKSFDSSKGIHFKSKIAQGTLLLLIGFLIGIISGLVGAGGGVMILITIIFILHYPMHEAVGTSTVIMAITALSSLVGYACEGHVDWQMGLIITIGALIAGVIGAKFANDVSEEKLNKIVAVIFILLGIMMIAMKFVK